ncbi:GNAT superfamily N-acetyltransferase [Bacillus pakistanensis]|uniref:GNAT superfamily N-acetyltransferase n=1 Tax=Rossellomorea pakistanensis TaxID=992288 RepID=A0ABS2N6K1_9BACI|nr:GNAT family N-acetyltransferase [Bacillus pakistanensis]MBM7583488.1 GNAT superfamily N-acetyltransferase [Bacillus pakistanensis]
MEIIEIGQKKELFNDAVHVFWKEWGNEDNFKFYQDCMIHSCKTEDEIPRFYVALINESIIGTYALIRNDLNSRQDLSPWLACLFVDPKYRGSDIGAKLLQHAMEETSKKGYENLYLTTDLEGYYERYGWQHLTDCYGVSGGSIKVYTKSVK